MQSVFTALIIFFVSLAASAAPDATEVQQVLNFALHQAPIESGHAIFYGNLANPSNDDPRCELRIETYRCAPNSDTPCPWSSATTSTSAFFSVCTYNDDLGSCGLYYISAIGIDDQGQLVSGPWNTEELSYSPEKISFTVKYTDDFGSESIHNDIQLKNGKPVRVFTKDLIFGDTVDCILN